jgi:hypothetical protein
MEIEWEKITIVSELLLLGGENKSLKYMKREFIFLLTHVVYWLCSDIGNK